jgi:hypothetical protein
MAFASYVESAGDELSSPLEYRLKNTSTSITNRRYTQLFCSGGNSYAPTGVKPMRWQISSDNPGTFLDTSSMWLKFTVSNQDASASISMANSAFCSFDRLRIYAGGNLLEDISSYNRVYAMLQAWLPTERKSMLSVSAGTQGTGIGSSSSQTFCVPLVCGLTMQDKLWPLRFAPLSIELDLVGTNAEALHSGTGPWVISDATILCDQFESDP